MFTFLLHPPRPCPPSSSPTSRSSSTLTFPCVPFRPPAPSKLKLFLACKQDTPRLHIVSGRIRPDESQALGTCPNLRSECSSSNPPFSLASRSRRLGHLHRDACSDSQGARATAPRRCRPQPRHHPRWQRCRPARAKVELGLGQYLHPAVHQRFGPKDHSVLQRSYHRRPDRRKEILPPRHGPFELRHELRQHLQHVERLEPDLVLLLSRCRKEAQPDFVHTAAAAAAAATAATAASPNAASCPVPSATLPNAPAPEPAPEPASASASASAATSPRHTLHLPRGSPASHQLATSRGRATGEYSQSRPNIVLMFGPALHLVRYKPKAIRMAL